MNETGEPIVTRLVIESIFKIVTGKRNESHRLIVTEVRNDPGNERVPFV
jgi:hypothetical protein